MVESFLPGISYEIIALFLTIVGLLVPFAIAFHRQGVLSNKLVRLEEDTKELKSDVKALTIRIESHILSITALEEGSNKDKK